MSYSFIEGRQYIAPTHFGPMAGPRHGPDGGAFPQPDRRRIEIFATGFRTDAEALRALLPPRFDLAGDPVVNLSAIYMSGIAWLAGRGYNALGFTVPVLFEGERDEVEGLLQLVLWENLTDAILTGRDQLGFAKIHCDLPEPRRTGARAVCQALWQGHRFLELELDGLRTANRSIPPPAPPGSGILNLRCVPDVADPGRARLVETTLVPFLPRTPDEVHERLEGEASIRFFETRWEDMPTQYRIVESLRALPVVEMLPASIVRGIGACDAHGQKVLA